MHKRLQIHISMCVCVAHCWNPIVATVNMVLERKCFSPRLDIGIWLIVMPFRGVPVATTWNISLSFQVNVYVGKLANRDPCCPLAKAAQSFDTVLLAAWKVPFQGDMFLFGLHCLSCIAVFIFIHTWRSIVLHCHDASRIVDLHQILPLGLIWSTAP